MSASGGCRVIFSVGVALWGIAGKSGAVPKRNGEHTRHRVLFSAPTPETGRNHHVRWDGMGAHGAKGGRTAGARFGTRDGACAPRPESLMLQMLDPYSGTLPFQFLTRPLEQESTAIPSARRSLIHERR